MPATTRRAGLERHGRPAPRLIVRCASVGDVVAAVRAAREHDLEIGIRCGGHSVVGHAVPEGGMMIDLTPMGAVRVDPDRRRAWVQGGALLGALDAASPGARPGHHRRQRLAHRGRRAHPRRRDGLAGPPVRPACDNVVSFEMVTAAGEVVSGRGDEHPELYWGLRGGGGNFGVVTEFEFRLHQIGTQALIVEFDFPSTRCGRRRCAGWRDLNATAPRQATFTPAIGTPASGSLGFVWVGDPDVGRGCCPPLRALGPAGRPSGCGAVLPRAAARDDTVSGHALRRYWKGHYFRELPDEAIEALLRGRRLPPVAARRGLQAYGGAIAEVPDEADRVQPPRHAFEFVGAAALDRPGRGRGAHGHGPPLRAPRSSRSPAASTSTSWATRGPRACAGPTRPRSWPGSPRSRTRYDPDNVFHLNQNIPPSTRQDVTSP